MQYSIYADKSTTLHLSLALVWGSRAVSVSLHLKQVNHMKLTCYLSAANDYTMCGRIAATPALIPPNSPAARVNNIELSESGWELERVGLLRISDAENIDIFIFSDQHVKPALITAKNKR